MFTVLLTLMSVNQALANDTLLAEALSRKSVSSETLSGMIATTNTMTGGAKPEVEHNSFDIKKHPDQAFASYDELREVIGSHAELVATTSGSMHYRFKTNRIPDGSSMPRGVKIDDDAKDIEFDGDAEVVRDAEGSPYVRHVQLHMRRANGPMIGRIKTMSLEYEFAPSPNGAGIVATNATADVSIRFLFFLRRSFSLKSQFIPTDSTALRSPSSE